MAMVINADRIIDHGARIREKRRGLPDMVINAARINDHSGKNNARFQIFSSIDRYFGI